MDKVVRHDGDTWRILAGGATRDGKTYCHLASTTRERQQKNGRVPVQIADWIDQQVAQSAGVQQGDKRSAADPSTWISADAALIAAKAARDANMRVYYSRLSRSARRRFLDD